MILVRLATSQDVPEMSRVLIASITELCSLDHNDDPAAIAAWTANKTPEGVARMLDTAGNQLLVAELDRQIAAVGTVIGTDEIGLNYVDPSHRFKGVSRALLEGMEELMRAAGATEGRLKSTRTAHDFYRSAGWVDAGPLYTGRFIDAIPMQKRL